MTRLLLAILLAATATATAFPHEAELYLLPRVERGGAVLAISDIAMIRGNGEAAARIGSLEIDPRLHADGYLDRRDITEALLAGGAEKVRIHGGGVRVVSLHGEDLHARSAPVIRRGAEVTFRAVRGGVRVETKGTAMGDGARGEIISVQVKGKTVSRGKVVDERTVELAL